MEIQAGPRRWLSFSNRFSNWPEDLHSATMGIMCLKQTNLRRYYMSFKKVLRSIREAKRHDSDNSLKAENGASSLL